MTVEAQGGFTKHFIESEASIGQLTDDWSFYYKDGQGKMNTLRHFETNGDMEPIVYNGIIYVRAGFLVDYLGYGATLNIDNHQLTFYHPNFQSEGLTEIHYKNPTNGEVMDPFENKDEENGQESEEELPDAEISAIVELMKFNRSYLVEAYDYLKGNTNVPKEDIEEMFEIAMEHSVLKADLLRSHADSYIEVDNYLNYYEHMYNTLVLAKKYNRKSDFEKFVVTLSQADEEITSLQSQE